MVSDNEPRYWLRDSNGDIVGSLYAKADGTLALQEGTSGSDNEVTFATGGTLTVDAVDATTTLTDPSGTDHTGELMDVGDPPTAHAASHAEGSSDPLDVGTLVDFDPEEFLIGTAANRPSAGTANRLYLSTDTAGGPVIERDTGSAWEVVAASTGALEDTGYAELNVGGLSGDLADAQDPKAHAGTHGADSADEVTVENLGTAGGSGLVPTSQGDGTLAMQSPGGGNVPPWEEDANSPISGTGQNSYTYTVSGSYDKVMVLFDNSQMNQTQLNGDQIRLNGSSSADYDYITNADTQTNSANGFELGAEFGATYAISVSEYRNAGLGINVSWVDTATGLLAYGSNNQLSTSIGSITFLDSGSANFDIEARIYGLNLGL